MCYFFQDHACALVTLGGEKGILVSGGVGEGDQLLDSVEFFSLGEEKVWRELSPLKVPRTEHGNLEPIIKECLWKNKLFQYSIKFSKISNLF